MSEDFKALKTLHLSFCAAVTIFYVLWRWLSADDESTLPKIDSPPIVSIAILVAAFVASHFLFKSRLKQMDTQLSLEDNLPAYRAASLIRWAMLEGGALLILVLNSDYMAFGVPLILYLIFLSPTEEKMRNDLQSY
jgi:hypothetical protein